MKRCSQEAAKYYKLWGVYCKSHGHKSSDSQLRHEFTLDALGYDKSHKDFSHSEFDLIYSALLCAINGLPFDRDEYVDAGEHGAARRKVYRILMEAPGAYVAKVAKGKFGTTDWMSLPLPQLEQLRITIIQRARNYRRRHGMKSSLYDNLNPVATAVGSESEPF